MADEGHDSNVLPGEWRYLPFLALPDGAHNYQEGRNSEWAQVHPRRPWSSSQGCSTQNQHPEPFVSSVGILQEFCCFGVFSS